MKILLAFTLLINCTLTLATAREHITYVDFVLLEQEQKREVIKLVQDYFLTSENVQNYIEFEEKNKSQSKKRTSFTKYLYNQFVAYAGTDSNDDVRKSCFYGGWISQYYINKSNTQKHGAKFPVCANPMRLSYSSEAKEPNENIFTNLGVNDNTNFDDRSKNAAIESGQYYDELQAELKTAGKKFIKIGLSESGDPLDLDLHTVTVGQVGEHGCNPASNIICNPMVYGRLDGAPFCVPKKSDDAYNTSFLCAKALDKVKTDQGEAVYNSVMDAAVSESLKKPKLFENTLINLYDSCMCKGSSYSFVDEDYASSMYNSRTCVAVLNSTKNIIHAVSRNNKCDAYSGGNLGEVSKMSTFFKRAYQHVNSEVSELNNTFSLGTINSVFNGDKSKRNIEQSRIRAIRSPLKRLREDADALNVAENKSCPISMDDDAKETELAVSGERNIETKTEKLTITFKINNEKVNINDGELTATLSQVNGARGGSVDGLDLSKITYSDGIANLIAPLNFSDDYTIDFSVSSNSQTGNASHNIARLSSSCSAEFSGEGAATTINVTASAIASSSQSAPITEDIIYFYKIGAQGDEIEFSSGSTVDLSQNTDLSNIAVFARLKGDESLITCDGKVNEANLILAKHNDETKHLELVHTFDVSLKKSNEVIKLSKSEQTDDKSKLSFEVIGEGLEPGVELIEKEDGMMSIIAQTYIDKTYKLKFNSTLGDLSATPLEVTIPQVPLVCKLLNFKIDGKNVSVDAQVLLGEKELTQALKEKQNFSIKYGNDKLEKQGTPTESIQKFSAELAQISDEAQLVGTLSMDGVTSAPINCSVPKNDDDEDTPIVDLTADGNSCTIEVKESDSTNEKVTLSAIITINSKDGETKKIETDSDKPAEGLEFKWIQVATGEREPSAADQEEMIVDQDATDQSSNNGTEKATTLAMSVNKGDAKIKYEAIASGSAVGDSGCSKVIEIDKKSTVAEQPKLNYGSQGSPGITPAQMKQKHRVRGNMRFGIR